MVTLVIYGRRGRTLHFIFVLLVDKLNGLYGDLLKRLDDSSDEIRVEVTRTLTLYIE